MGDYDAWSGEADPGLNQSILSNMADRYPECHQVTLDITYRMNSEICAFPSKIWYGNRLKPAPSVENARLQFAAFDETANPSEDESILTAVLNPQQPVALVLADHQGCSQQSDMEADLMVALARHLLVYHGLSPDQMALITPHRAQNNVILQRLAKIMAETWRGPEDIRLPLVDTVERVQGAERDVILFGLTASDPDHMSSEFLNNPNRLNVAMTRARKKLVIIGSKAFFSVIPQSESLLVKNCCFKQLLAHCSAENAVFNYPPGAS